MVANRLAEVLFIQAIRAHISSGAESCKRGWLRAIFDPQIGAALTAIHSNITALGRSNRWPGPQGCLDRPLPSGSKDCLAKRLSST